MTTTKQTAAEAYADARHDAIKAIDTLMDRLFDCPDPGSAGLNWGHVGSLRHAIQQLKDVETHLAAMTTTTEKEPDNG
jgi:hypothetical protein